jgi:hypothetical protein
MPRRHALALALILPLAAMSGATGCGGKGAAAGGETKPDLDSDPLALLPAAAVVIARVDTRAVYSSPAAGAEIAAFTDSLVPLGEDAGFRASRDVDRVLVGVYATSNTDVAAVLSGRFDLDHLAHATKTKQAGPVVAAVYAGFPTYTAGRIAWAPLTARTLVAGTPEGVHEVLDRATRPKLERWEPPWMATTLETATAQIAVAGDFATQPIAAAAIGSISLPWVSGIRAVRALGAIKPGGLDVTATLTYADVAKAQEAAGGIRRSEQLLDVFGPLLGGLRLQGFDVTLDAQDVHCSFGVDAQALRTLVSIAPRFIPTLPQ